MSVREKIGFNLIHNVFDQFFVKSEYILSNVSCGNQVLALVNSLTGITFKTQDPELRTNWITHNMMLIPFSRFVAASPALLTHMF